MKIKFLMLPLLALLSFNIQAQEEKTLTLKEAIQLALENSDQSKILNTQVQTAEADLKSLKNLQYPDVGISGQYMYVTNPDVKLKIPLGDEGNAEGNVGETATTTPEVHNILLGQANVSMPVFSGFKLKNTIKAGKNKYQAQVYASEDGKEQLALQTIHDYVSLYKARKTVELLQENIKRSTQRVTDFQSMEENGLLARNDLLKAQLQQSNDQLALEEARKNAYILNYKLVTTLKLSETTTIKTVESDFGLVSDNIYELTQSRSDLQALQYQEKAAEDQVKVAKSAYYPSLSLSAGYIALDVENIVTVKNAMNFGVGLSYNLADIFKAKSDVRAAESRQDELKYRIDKATDEIKLEIENAKQEYELALKKYEVYTESEEQASENYRIVKDKYDNGLVDTNDLLEADVDQLQAKINLAYANADISEKYYELLTAEGIVTTKFND